VVTVPPPAGVGHHERGPGRLRTDPIRNPWQADAVETTNPTARALLALELIQGSPGITAERLGERLGVSDRAARRYVGTLREAGIPVESVRGPYGCYRLGRGMRVPPLMFSQTEALGLVMAVLDGHHAAADVDDPVGSALGKIVRVLPAPVAAQAEAVRRTAAAPDRGASRPEPGTTATLVGAVGDTRRCRVEYRTEAGTELDVEVDPWAVVVRHGRWYLLCHSHAAGAPRTYRVDRIRRVTVLDEAFEPPVGLDPVADLERHLGAGWEYDVEVVLEAPYDQARRRMPGAMGRFEPDGEERTRVVGSTSNPWMYAEWLAASPWPFRVVRGPELAHAVRATAQRMLDSLPEADPGPTSAGVEPGELVGGELERGGSR
jgi:predicted DNA-binding transcriptional regulator YafY